jgi:excisionase family DNA binding protein
MHLNSDTGVRMPAGYMRVRSAANELGCSERTVLRRIQDGTLRKERIGLRYWAVLREDVEHVSARRPE